MSFILGDTLGTKPCIYPYKKLPAGHERYLGCVAGVAAVAVARIGSSSVFCNALRVECPEFYAFFESWVEIAVEWLY